MLCFDAVAKRYGETTVFRGVSFNVQPGEALLVRGRNGSGKSTLLTLAAGVSLQDSGTVQRKSEFAYTGHGLCLYDDLTVAQNFDALGSNDILQKRPYLQQLLVELELQVYLEKRIRILSRGTKQKVALALALIDSRPLWIMDEPFTALDQETRAIVDSHIQQHLDRGGGLVWATHVEACPLIDRSRIFSLSENVSKQHKAVC